MSSPSSSISNVTSEPETARMSRRVASKTAARPARCLVQPSPSRPSESRKSIQQQSQTSRSSPEVLTPSETPSPVPSSQASPSPALPPPRHLLVAQTLGHSLENRSLLEQNSEMIRRMLRAVNSKVLQKAAWAIMKQFLKPSSPSFGFTGPRRFFNGRFTRVFEEINALSYLKKQPQLAEDLYELVERLVKAVLVESRSNEPAQSAQSLAGQSANALQVQGSGGAPSSQDFSRGNVPALSRREAAKRKAFAAQDGSYIFYMKSKPRPRVEVDQAPVLPAGPVPAVFDTPTPSPESLSILAPAFTQNSESSATNETEGQSTSVGRRDATLRNGKRKALTDCDGSDLSYKKSKLGSGEEVETPVLPVVPVVTAGPSLVIQSRNERKVSKPPKRTKGAKSSRQSPPLPILTSLLAQGRNNSSLLDNHATLIQMMLKAVNDSVLEEAAWTFLEQFRQPNFPSFRDADINKIFDEIHQNVFERIDALAYLDQHPKETKSLCVIIKTLVKAVLKASGQL